MSDTVSAEDLDFVRIDADLVESAIATLTALRRHGRKMVSAESCTGGLIATVLSEAPGANCRPSTDLAAEDRLQSLALPLIGPFDRDTFQLARIARSFSSHATMNKKASLPSLRSQGPTWDEAAKLAREWQLNQLAGRLEHLIRS